MASFIAKQLVGDQLKSVKGAVGDGEKKEEGPTEEEQLEHEEALREEEERRKEKHRKMEEEREKIRQATRDKYGLKKKEPEQPLGGDADGRLGRKKKPQEMEAGGGGEEVSDSPFPKDLNDLKARVTDVSGKVMTSVSEASDKCIVQ